MSLSNLDRDRFFDELENGHKWMQDWMVERSNFVKFAPPHDSTDRPADVEMVCQNHYRDIAQRLQRDLDEARDIAEMIAHDIHQIAGMKMDIPWNPTN